LTLPSPPGPCPGRLSLTQMAEGGWIVFVEEDDLPEERDHQWYQA
jgi:hypothetical protein